MHILVHLATAVAALSLAFALGRWLRDPAPGAEITGVLLLVGLVALAARRLYRPGGLGRRPVADAAPPPAPAPAPAQPPPPPLWLSDDRVDVNTASDAELRTLPGIGPVTAQRIVAERERGGPYASVADLSRVGGFGPARMHALADRMRV